MSMFLSRVLAGREVEQARSSERRRSLDRRGQRAAQAPMLSNDDPAAFAKSHEEYGVYFCRAFGAIDVNQLFRKGYRPEPGSTSPPVAPLCPSVGQHAPLPAAGHASCEIRIVARFNVQCFSVHDQHGYVSVRQDF
ncbi:hypothetical protein JEY40_37270 [Bradyrhizobium japonicum]|uniref:hypothetical protein n=1 Tax=Bradyrhizobium japonicum TaxID=375 RepID=UPI00126A042A|nr:hypothetical protein [Bradyrhizobium japonicum]UQD71446.1 hypothetical protein JEY40_37270 [Bradyrhizobium japonicum]